MSACSELLCWCSQKLVLGGVAQTVVCTGEVDGAGSLQPRKAEGVDSSCWKSMEKVKL